MVDANGVWVYGVDKNSPVGKGLIARLNKDPSILEAALEKQGLDSSDFEDLQQNIVEEGQQKTADEYPADALEGIEKAVQEGIATTSLWVTGEQNPLDYQDRQLHVAITTPDRKEWEKKITDFITYCNKQGLRITYTPFDQTENTPVTLSPDMTPQEIDQAAKTAVINFEKSRE